MWLLQLPGGGLCSGLVCCSVRGHHGGRVRSLLSGGAGGKGGGLCWAKRFSNAPGRARRGVDCFRFWLGSASPPTSPGPAGGAHGRLSGKFAICCSPLWSCSHASPGGQFRQYRQLRSPFVCPVRSSRGIGGRRCRRRCSVVRLPCSYHQQGGVLSQVRCHHCAV